MQALIDGIGWGLVLTIMLGPIFFALIQAGIEQGFRAGAMVGLGIWISDILFILITYWSMAYVISVSESENFELYLGTIGGVLLMGFGIGTILSKPPHIPGTKKGSTKGKPKSYLALWTKGFLINTVNPFTFFFWIGIITTRVTDDGYNSSDAVVFLGAILGTIIITDSLKAYLAKRIRQKLKLRHVILLRRISGAALFLFGVALIIRVLV